MIRLTLAAIGILLIAFGGEAGITVGSYCLLPAILSIIWIIVSKIIEWIKDLKDQMDDIKNQNTAHEAKERNKQEKLQQQANLVERYKKSPLTAEILKDLCGSNTSTCLPTQIIIFDDCIQGKIGESVRTFSFAQHRVHSFEPVIETVSNKLELKYVVKPQIAMAEAINALLSDQYEIFDNAKETQREHRFSDGDKYTTTTYVSDHVTMVLKNTLPNRYF